ncbi:hypothetical protein EVA_21236 [gut metagenome]|uniref:Uncharacterized protein n=1 Tax=gut metagenome TaxID=749906 RepID=J9FM38_9ZZZZ
MKNFSGVCLSDGGREAPESVIYFFSCLFLLALSSPI